jgi:ethanolamine permease
MPARALIVFTLVGLISVVLVANGKAAAVDVIIINMAIFGAVISYILMLLSYIKLKLARPDLERPYKSPLGIWGAYVGSALAIAASIACFYTPDYRPGAWGVLATLGVATVYYFLFARYRLVAQAPEEAAALPTSRF